MPHQDKTLRTPLLEIAYRETGPPGGRPVLLLHGWPDSPDTWDAVAERLGEAGLRTYAPYLRGFGPTRFRDATTRRSGQITAIAQDALDFADALGLEKLTLVGHDWGGRAAYLLAARWPGRVERLVALSVPYGSDPNQPLPPRQGRAYWYQWFFQTEQARHALERDRRGLCRFLWETWMPTGHFDEAAFAATAPAWDNPDWVDVTLSSYRKRWGNALSAPGYEALEATQLLAPPIGVPTVILHGEEDGASLPSTTEGQEAQFTAGYRRETLPGVGHFIPREHPEAVVNVVLQP